MVQCKSSFFVRHDSDSESGWSDVIGQGDGLEAGGQGDGWPAEGNQADRWRAVGG